MNKKIGILIVIIVIIALLTGGIIYMVGFNKKPSTVEPAERIEKNNTNTNFAIVLSLEDKIGQNTAWCGTFNLIWNDLKNDLAKQDIEFTPQLDLVRNLNKGTFHTSYLSQDSYYKVYGVPSLQLKGEIEKAIQEKFNETSDILDDFNWGDANPEDYFLYAMLKKQFEFPKVFSDLEEGTFGNYENVKYFGINQATEDEVRNQVEVLYYNSKEDFAIKLQTKGNDEVILTKGNNEDTFGKSYEEVKQKSEKYKGNHSFAKADLLKIPNIKFDLKEEFKELQNKDFKFSNGKIYHIEKALQTIQFELDKKGGKIKSEAGIMLKNDAMTIDQEEPREFIIDDMFTIFLVENGKDLPYFSAKIEDITKVQSNAKIKDETEVQSKQNEESQPYFYGKVIEEGRTSMIVEPNEGEEIRKSADKIVIDLGEENDMIYPEGTQVKISHTGFIKDTYPAQIDLVNIEIMNR